MANPELCYRTDNVIMDSIIVGSYNNKAVKALRNSLLRL